MLTQKVGQKLIEWLIDYSSKHAIQEISLSVSKDNYAINLYKQQGFQEYADRGDASTMVRKYKHNRSFNETMSGQTQGFG